MSGTITPRRMCYQVGTAHEAHYWWYTPKGGGHMLLGEPDATDGDCSQFYCGGITELHSSCCWCGRAFLGPSGTVRGCVASPSGLHEHVAGHADRINTGRRATGRDHQDHSEMHPEKKPITLCVWCGGDARSEGPCDERPDNRLGTLRHQTLAVAKRTVRREVEAWKARQTWLFIRDAIDGGDLGDAALMFEQAIQSARNAGRNDAQRERDEAAKRKEQES